MDITYQDPAEFRAFLFWALCKQRRKIIPELMRIVLDLAEGVKVGNYSSASRAIVKRDCVHSILESIPKPDKSRETDTAEAVIVE